MSIRVPHRSREDSISEVAEAASVLPPDERAVNRALYLELAQQGATDAGDVLDTLGALDEPGRRALVNRAAAKVGFGAPAPKRPPAVHGGMHRDELGFALMSCAEDGCREYPARPESGATMPVNVKRWWCPDHVHGTKRTWKRGRPGCATAHRVRSNTATRSIPKPLASSAKRNTAKSSDRKPWRHEPRNCPN